MNDTRTVPEAVELAKQLIDFPTVSRWSNVAISDHLQWLLNDCGFEVERLSYADENGEEKVSLVGKKGDGADGLAFFSHTDTVPGQEEDWDPFEAVIEHDRVVGRGSCDMKGPLAATVVAAAKADEKRLRQQAEREAEHARARAAAAAVAKQQEEMMRRRQELVDGHTVEARQAVQSGYGYGALTAFVGPEDRCLELRLRPGLDILQREPLLPADQPDAFP